jgi:hypothetical protein
VFALARLWELAIANALHTSSRFRAKLFTTPTPWDGTPTERRRWTGAQKLLTWLDEQRIPHDEFCAAIANHYQWMNKRFGKRLAPNIVNMRKQRSVDIWKRWRAHHVKAGNGTFMRVVGAATIATQSVPEALVEQLKLAYRDCKANGVKLALSFLWPAEILYVLVMTEPTARDIILHELSCAAPETQQRYHTAFATLASRSEYLLWLKRQAFGTSAPIL